MMFNLRVYTNRLNAGGMPIADRVFYSQRTGGPHYRWRDEKGLGQWRFTRLHPAEWRPETLFSLHEKDLPAALLEKLADHYPW